MTRRWRIALAIGLALPLTALFALEIRHRLREWRDSPTVVERQIARLTVERDSLRALILDSVTASALFSRRPSGDVVIGLPAPFVTALVQDAVVEWFRDVEVTLRGLKVNKVADVYAQLGFLGRRRVGSYDLRMTLDEVRGRLKAGIPALNFGGDEIGIALPVRVTGGSVMATIDIAWDSRGLADVVCGDLRVTREVTGLVTPSRHVAVGRILLAERQGDLVADPDFPGLAVRLFADPATASLAILDSILESKGGLCGVAIERMDPGEKIVARVERGFLVRIPQKFFRPVRLPISLDTSVPVGGKSLALAIRLTGLAVTESTVWLGADVAIARPSPLPP